jgi:hypothetical protein
MTHGRRSRPGGGFPLSKRALLQHVNGELWRLAGDTSPIEVYCECGRDDCILSLDVSRDDFAAARRHPASAIVVPGHKARLEPVLERFAEFVVVTDADADEPPPGPGLDPDRVPDRL